ncbi:UDP-N-acetylmuramate dehydrogenase [Pseudoxanthomonas dokdonensis]|uniref:UDP-N-acetylenolpyruvoylglucosamine reductase n=1 Tax=Pseudoxanthomonas dokdonensis TaxID=344882 RepID=A0A0R0CXU0_9GAMM|nr:UDP-N-acetylmuramate dehydrogenase [Pseudoxanthomonas dokdonensis]KRG70894.1 UDP-N-acetylenolpyruvoylglucosamine reductase [Pseudoxanthomonas dokdonensis]
MSAAPYRLRQDVALDDRNTLGVAAVAPWLIELDDAAALPRVLSLPQAVMAPLLVLGGGSNLLFAGNPAGAVLQFSSGQRQILDERDGKVRIHVDAGVGWHELVMWSLQQGLCGLENLALIPGTVGAAPIQNIGAYGREVGDYIHQVDAWDRQQQRWVQLDRAACGFAYRDSVFKREVDRFIVTSVQFLLPRQAPLQLDYAGIGEELQAMGIQQPNASDVAQAVIRIRQRKLPDPALIGNAGSFFKNPIIDVQQADALLARHPSLPVFAGPDAGSRKISAAWMIDACGWKGFREGDGGVADSHALVLVNHGHASGPQMLSIGRRIATSVEEAFGVEIEPEPRIIGARW